MLLSSSKITVNGCVRRDQMRIRCESDSIRLDQTRSDPSQTRSDARLIFWRSSGLLYKKSPKFVFSSTSWLKSQYQYADCQYQYVGKVCMPCLQIWYDVTRQHDFTLSSVCLYDSFPWFSRGKFPWGHRKSNYGIVPYPQRVNTKKHGGSNEVRSFQIDHKTRTILT